MISTKTQIKSSHIELLYHISRELSSRLDLRELIERTVGGERWVSLSLSRPASGRVDGFDVHEDGRRIEARVADVGAELPGLIERARLAGCAIDDVEVRRQGLHEVFLHLTGRDLRE
ncbi:MAG: hypothetical protein HYR73_05575 [Candidatus Eisenbacteria bacterium]|nr:hypothetical protein [Candidatus Eisenbacteria bacterium]